MFILFIQLNSALISSWVYHNFISSHEVNASLPCFREWMLPVWSPNIFTIDFITMMLVMLGEWYLPLNLWHSAIILVYNSETIQYIKITNFFISSDRSWQFHQPQQNSLTKQVPTKYLFPFITIASSHYITHGFKEIHYNGKKTRFASYYYTLDPKW